MVKTTDYLPEELELRLDAESASTGISKAELIRRGIALLLQTSPRSAESEPLPVFTPRSPAGWTPSGSFRRTA